MWRFFFLEVVVRVFVEIKREKKTPPPRPCSALFIHQNRFPSILSLCLPRSPTNAPAQPQEVSRGDRGIVAEEIDHQVAAGGLDEDRHFSSSFFSPSGPAFQKEEAKKSEKNVGDGFVCKSELLLFFRKKENTTLPLFFSFVSGSSAPEPH